MRTILLAAALLFAGCVTETRGLGRDPVDAAHKGGWGGKGGSPSGEEPGSSGPDASHDAFFDPPARDPRDVVEVPVEAYQPLDGFFDQEGYLVGDRIEIDCSFQPFMARLVALAYADVTSKYVIREEGRSGDVHWVRLRALTEGPAYQQNFQPRATFGSQRRNPEVADASGKPVALSVRPIFEFVGTEEVVVRMHLTSDPSRPVWFQARAIGTPAPLRPESSRDCVYVNARRGRREKGPDLALRLEIRRGADGKWESLIEDPGR